MHKVLLPVDGLHCSEKAARYLLGFLHDVGKIELHLLNVQPLAEDWEVRSFLQDEEIKRMTKENATALMEPVRDILDDAGISYAVHIEQGEVAETIARYCKDLGCDQVVMGTHGKGALEGLLLGSVATKVLHLVTVPVTLVK